MIVQALEIGPSNFPPATIATLDKLINLFIPLLQTGAALVFLVMLLYGGFTWITSGDNPENVKKAQKTLTYAVFGILTVALSYLVVKLIIWILNVNSAL